MLNLSNQPRYQRMKDSGASDEEIIAAGFFEESDEAIDVPLPEIPEGIILLLTGCFAPIHQGHLEAMKDAKEYVEKVLGKKVSTGFFGFCHDNYVSSKTEKWSYDKRKEYFLDHPLKSDWMLPLEYEAKNSCSLNFTTVYDALVKKYNREVIMLCGSDNQDFHKVFTEDETVIIFKRDLKSIGTMSKNVVSLESRNPSVSSSKIRNVSTNLCNP